MIWTVIEWIAILAECFMVARLMIRYFGFRSPEKRLLKWGILVGILVCIDALGSFLIQNEIILVAGFVLTNFIYAAILCCHIAAGKLLRKNGGSRNFLYVVLFYQPSGFNSSQFAFRVCTSGNRKYFKSTVKSCIRNIYYQAALLCVNASDFAGSEKRGLSFQDK